MSWDGYIANIMANDFVDDCAIVGYKTNSLWAAHPSGSLKNITTQEIKDLDTKAKDDLMCKGISLAGIRCTVLRDARDTEGDYTMDIRTKASADDSCTYSICIAKSLQAFVIIKAKKDIHGGRVNKVAFDLGKYLRGTQY